MLGFSLTSTVRKLERECSRLKTTIEGKDALLQAKEKSIEEQERLVKAKDDAMAAKDRALASSEALIQINSGELNSTKIALKAAADEREKLLSDCSTLTATIASKDVEISTLGQTIESERRKRLIAENETSILRSRTYFTPEYRKCLAAIFSDDKSPLFISGPAGTGKSTLVKIARSIFMAAHPSRAFQVVAPTGIAAENIQGRTIHSFFRFAPAYSPRTGYDTDNESFRQTIDVIRRTDILVVDEASMVNADLVDAMDEALRYLQGRNNLPFGGTKVVFIGDMGQLPPVSNKTTEPLNMEKYGFSKPYFFDAKSINAYEIKKSMLRLSTIFRQTEEPFIRALLEVRKGPNAVSPESATLLASRYDSEPPPPHKRTTLFAINNQAKAANDEALRLLPGNVVSFEMETRGDVSDAQKQDSKYPVVLELKIGARVILLDNNLPQYSNGTIGMVKAFSKDIINVELPSGKIAQITRSTIKLFENKVLDDDTVQQVETGSISQFPMKLAWGLTIHKSQGQTLDEVWIDLSRVFEYGQTYTALSRVRTLEGLKILQPFDVGKILSNPRVLEWL